VNPAPVPGAPGAPDTAPPHVGIGLRHAHAAALLQSPPSLAFVEVHSENYFADGGAALALLQEARGHWPVSLHGVGLSLGSAAGLDPWHLDRLAALVQRIEPVRVSDHASFARAPLRPGQAVLHAHDLLPIGFNAASLQLMATHVQQVQERLRRPILVEHLSAYLGWADDDIAEPDFFNQLTQRTGCGLLLDVNNLVVNALNQQRSRPGGPPRDEAAAVQAACAWVDAIRPDSVGEIHLAGYHDTGDLVIDDHGSRVHAPVWQVFGHAIRRLGARPVLVEWDTALPALPVLLDEAARAGSMLAALAGRAGGVVGTDGDLAP
jgi:uncharacterized protein